jgi:LysM repeat protein
MYEYNIPASITIAQGLFESGAGQSNLAKMSNNHFGIKCGGDWTGESITYDDDSKGECFRKYLSVQASYDDHSIFLDSSPRYDFLFSLDPKDYVGWAKGLKKAGYATNPQYAERLINLIEKYELYKLDEDGGERFSFAEPEPEPSPVPEIEQVIDSTKIVDPDNYTVTIDSEQVSATSTSSRRVFDRPVHYNNGVAFVVVESGDTFDSLAIQLQISKKKLLKFNDMTQEIALKPGSAIYIAKKKNRSGNGRYAHNVRPGDTMHSISQKYGIRLKKLVKMNAMQEGEMPSLNRVVRLQ